MLSENSLTQNLEKLRQTLRSGQLALADWSEGEWAISAVPGAGKSYSLSVAAAITIARHQLQGQRQLMIVTYTRSAAAGIKNKVKQRLRELNLPGIGFSVQTLHSLALQIASRHPELSGLNSGNSTLIIPNINHRILRETVENWIKVNPDIFQDLLETGDFDGEETERLRRQSVLRTEVLPSLTLTVVAEAKSSGLLPESVWKLSYLAQNDKILTVGAGLYEHYQKLMSARNWIDYDDMILAAINVLGDRTVGRSWQQQIFAVFEDEAQDSSPLQEQLITRLAQDPDDPKIVNLIRVGDPNQAINSTFTPADPMYFNWFCENCQKQGKFTTMDQAGRSSQIIIDAANFVLDWVNNNVNQKENNNSKIKANLAKVLNQPFRSQNIKAVNKNDPQPNPLPTESGLELVKPTDIFESVKLIGKRAIALLKANPEHNAAILVRENRQAHFIADQLENLAQSEDIPLYEVNSRDRFSKIPGEILGLLQFIDRPHSPDYLKTALTILQNRDLIPAQDINALAIYPEQFIYPSSLVPEANLGVKIARYYCQQLLQAKIELPHYQLIPFLGIKLNYDGSQLATLQKLSERIQQQIYLQNTLKMTIETLQEIIKSERFEEVEAESDDLYTRSGQITIITMHKAKGLDWDYVFIPFLHQDSMLGEAWIPISAKFLGDYTLSEVARAQIRTAVHHQYLYQKQVTELPNAIAAWQTAQTLKEAEAYRLFYVAMTRAKRLLWLAAEQQAPFHWSTFDSQKNSKLNAKIAAPVFVALQEVFIKNYLR